jgi:hypothetical protein
MLALLETPELPYQVFGRLTRRVRGLRHSVVIDNRRCGGELVRATEQRARVSHERIGQLRGVRRAVWTRRHTADSAASPARAVSEGCRLTPEHADLHVSSGDGGPRVAIDDHRTLSPARPADQPL